MSRTFARRGETKRACIFVEKPQRRVPLRKTKKKGDMKIALRNRRQYWDWIQMARDCLMTYFREHCDETSGFIKVRNFRNQVSNSANFRFNHGGGRVAAWFMQQQYTLLAMIMRYAKSQSSLLCNMYIRIWNSLHLSITRPPICFPHC